MNWMSGSRTPVSGDVLHLLDLLPVWTSAAALAEKQPALGAVGDVAKLLHQMCRADLLEAKGRTPTVRLWDDWSPEAAFFHFGTRDSPYAENPRAYDAQLRDKAKHRPPPPPTNSSVPGPRVLLPQARLKGSLEHALHTRRTWRRFSRRPIPLSVVSTLARTTWGVQRWGHVRGQGKVPLKTSPSGGARHSGEVYLLALNVDGLPRGAYQFDAASHHLVDLGRPCVDGLGRILGNQPYFEQAAAVFVMTAVFARAMWRYPYSRAYRALLAEAGHLGQTFCLVATALELAPFCTMAFRDSDVEQLIGVDGVHESAMYVVGVGSRPAGPVTHPGRIPRRFSSGKQ